MKKSIYSNLKNNKYDKYSPNISSKNLCLNSTSNSNSNNCFSPDNCKKDKSLKFKDFNDSFEVPMSNITKETLLKAPQIKFKQINIYKVPSLILEDINNNNSVVNDGSYIQDNTSYYNNYEEDQDNNNNNNNNNNIYSNHNNNILSYINDIHNQDYNKYFNLMSSPAINSNNSKYMSSNSVVSLYSINKNNYNIPLFNNNTAEIYYDSNSKVNVSLSDSISIDYKSNDLDNSKSEDNYFIGSKAASNSSLKYIKKCMASSSNLNKSNLINKQNISNKNISLFGKKNVYDSSNKSLKDFKLEDDKTNNSILLNDYTNNNNYNNNKSLFLNNNQENYNENNNYNNLNQIVAEAKDYNNYLLVDSYSSNYINPSKKEDNAYTTEMLDIIQSIKINKKNKNNKSLSSKKSSNSILSNNINNNSFISNIESDIEDV